MSFNILLNCIYLMVILGMLNSFFFQIRISTSKIRIKFELRLYICGKA